MQLLHAREGALGQRRQPGFVHFQFVHERAAVARVPAHGLVHGGGVVGDVILTIKFKHAVVIVAAHAEIGGGIFQHPAREGERPHGGIGGHVHDFTAQEALAAAPGGHAEIGTVGIYIGIAEFVDAGVLKQPRRGNHHRVTVQGNHVVPQLHHPRGAGVGGFALRHAAAKIEVGAAVVVHQHGGVKQPGDGIAGGGGAADQRMAQRVGEGAGGAVRRQHADAARAVGEVQEELVLPVDGFPRRAGSPGIARPLGRAGAACGVHRAVILPVHQIVGGRHAQGRNIAVIVGSGFPVQADHGLVPGHVQVHPAIVHHRPGVRAKALHHHGIMILQGFIHTHSIFLLLHDRIQAQFFHRLLQPLVAGNQRNGSVLQKAEEGGLAAAIAVKEQRILFLRRRVQPGGVVRQAPHRDAFDIHVMLRLEPLQQGKQTAVAVRQPHLAQGRIVAGADVQLGDMDGQAQAGVQPHRVFIFRQAGRIHGDMALHPQAVHQALVRQL